jgi:hypothetical protein
MTQSALPRVRGWASRKRLASRGLGDGAETHQRVVRAPVRLAPHIGDRKAQIDQAVAGERERRVIERLQQRACDQIASRWPPWRDQACSVSWCSSPRSLPVDQSITRASPIVT